MVIIVEGIITFRHNFLSAHLSIRPGLVSIQTPIQWELWALSPGVKWQGSKANHSPPTSAKVNKTWIYTSTPPYIFMT
jgi:hypothetical protein